MNLIDLQTFVRVADTGSLSRAAAELALPKSTVSRRVARLENELGLSLLHRAGRAVTLTDHGRHLHARSADALRELDLVGQEILDGSQEPRGTLRITAPHDLGSTAWFADVLTGYRRRCPGVQVEVALDNRVVRMIEERFDIAFRPDADRLSDTTTLMARRITRVIAFSLFASADYVARRGEPRTLEELPDHACVTHAGMQRSGGWPLQNDAGEVTLVRIEPVLTVNDLPLMGGCVLGGAGIGVVPQIAAAPHVRAGKLVPILPEWHMRPSSLWIVWPASRHLAPRIRAFVDHVTEASSTAEPWAS